MAELRSRMRLSLEAGGEGDILETGESFRFDVLDFSVAGLQLKLHGGATPNVGETLYLSIDMGEEGAASPFVNVAGTVRRIGREGGSLLCGVEVTEIVAAEDGAILDEAYLERYFEALD